MERKLHIREALDADLNRVLTVERLAFGQLAEADLVQALLADPSAKPLLSLLAFRDDQAVGHILLTRARLAHPQRSVSLMLLAPLAVIPEAQRQGVGGQLIKAGLQKLSATGVDLVFVLGYPAYYSRYGFVPAGPLGLTAPYPIPKEHTDAWMVQALKPNLIGSVKGQLMCANAINKPEYWQE